MRNSRTFEIKANKTKFIVSEGEPDYQRLVRCFENIAAGLFFKGHGKVFSGEFGMFLGFIKYNDERHNTFVKFIRERWKVDEHKYPIKGDNPEVFTYQMADADEHGITGLKMVFFHGTEIYLAFMPSDKEKPYLLQTDLIYKGIHSVITVGDKIFEFNKPSESKQSES